MIKFQFRKVFRVYSTGEELGNAWVELIVAIGPSFTMEILMESRMGASWLFYSQNLSLKVKANGEQSSTLYEKDQPCCVCPEFL